jgi:hypothetical protein
MKRCPVCDLLNFDDAISCTSCSNPFPQKKRKGYFHSIRWHLLALILVVGMMLMLKFRGGELFGDFGKIISDPAPGQVEISSVRIYTDLTGEAVVEGILKNLSQTLFTNLSLEISLYDGQDKKLGQHDHPISSLPQGKFTPFLAKFPPYENLDHAHFTLRSENKKELYLINRAVKNLRFK